MGKAFAVGAEETREREIPVRSYHLTEEDPQEDSHHEERPSYSLAAGFGAIF